MQRIIDRRVSADAFHIKQEGAGARVRRSLAEQRAAEISQRALHGIHRKGAGLASARGGDGNLTGRGEFHVTAIGCQDDAARIGVARQIVKLAGRPGHVDGAADRHIPSHRAEGELSALQLQVSIRQHRGTGEREARTEIAEHFRSAGAFREHQIAAGGDRLVCAPRAGDARRGDGEVAPGGEGARAFAEHAARRVQRHLIVARHTESIHPQPQRARSDLQRARGYRRCRERRDV